MTPDWPYGTLDLLCGQVGLSRMPRLPTGNPGTDMPPEEAAYWAGSYAKLVLWPVG